MNILFPYSHRKTERVVSQFRTGQPVHLTRAFVETGDERCPIAGIWSRLIESDQQADDPELRQPAMGSFHSWRAFIRASFSGSTVMSHS